VFRLIPSDPSDLSNYAAHMSNLSKIESGNPLFDSCVLAFPSEFSKKTTFY